MKMATAKRALPILGAGLGVFLCAGQAACGQEPLKVNPHIHVAVDLVQLNVAITDNKGKYVTGLPPGDFTILEDGIPQKVATFAEGSEPTLKLDENAKTNPKDTGENAGSSAQLKEAGDRISTPELGPVVAGASVFILFDTSNYMYRGFVFAQDAISDFIRSLEAADRIAFYSYSRGLSRATRLTSERPVVLRGVRTTVAGDNAALYNCLLLTVKDAAQFVGRKVIVVFSNG